MFNRDAPIVPGKSAAGIRLGQATEEIVALFQPLAITSLDNSVKLHFENASVWVKNNRVAQIGVSGDYRGLVAGRIGVGMTLREVQSALGQVIEDAADNLVVTGMEGWCLETEAWRVSPALADNLDARIVWIFVYGVGD